jgi:membrane-associated protease RseP (regulator of RpoE activity)
MVGRVRNNTIYIGGAGTAQPLDGILAKADARSPLQVQTAAATVGGRGGIGPSDHESFALKKIPVVFFFSGMHPDYHRATDDPDKINYLGMAEVVDMAADVVNQLDAMPPMQYVDKYDYVTGGTRGSMGGVQLGIMPDYNSDDGKPGVRVAGTVPDTAAARAGLKEGDVIIGFDDAKVAGLGDYMAVLGKHKPGDKVKVKILRDNQEMQLVATLGERRAG